MRTGKGPLCSLAAGTVPGMPGCVCRGGAFPPQWGCSALCACLLASLELSSGMGSGSPAVSILVDEETKTVIIELIIAGVLTKTAIFIFLPLYNNLKSFSIKCMYHEISHFNCFNYKIQWHQGYSHCCTTVTAIHGQDVSILLASCSVLMQTLHSLPPAPGDIPSTSSLPLNRLCCVPRTKQCFCIWFIDCATSLGQNIAFASGL